MGANSSQSAQNYLNNLYLNLGIKISINNGKLSP